MGVSLSVVSALAAVSPRGPTSGLDIVLALGNGDQMVQGYGVVQSIGFQNRNSVCCETNISKQVGDGFGLRRCFVVMLGDEAGLVVVMSRGNACCTIGWLFFAGDLTGVVGR